MTTPDVNDTIAAIATAAGGAARGVVRLSGPGVQGVLTSLGFDNRWPDSATRFPTRRLRAAIGGAVRPIEADVFVWPDERSYTRQPSAELHTVGSAPVLDALVRACLAAGARMAEPGEFTLRAMLAGRLDLTQTEAVLSVIDAADADELRPALERLAGGLSTPLHRLRAELLGLLADLEAGLDFVEEEDVRFVEPEELAARLDAAWRLVAETIDQLSDRDTAERLPTVAIAGPPNAGKSSLFNALAERHGVGQSPRALVADQPGVTRDAVVAVIDLNGQRAQLVDTAGDDHLPAIDPIDLAARRSLDACLSAADVVLRCGPAPTGARPTACLLVATKADLAPPTSPDAIATSAKTGQGLDRLADAIQRRLAEAPGERSALGLASDRARVGLETAAAALGMAREAARLGGGEELVALELREALDGLGRVVGQVVTDEVLGEIFSRFCIGK